MRNLSQKDIAASLNISRVTVTKALQDHPDIAVKTKRKVQQAAREMGYLPNRIGRSLSTQKTHAIGVVVPKIAHSFFSEAIEIMYEQASLLGYQIILTVSFEDATQEFANVQTLLSMPVDGLIIDSTSGEPHADLYELLRKRQTPYLFFDRKPTELDEVPGVLMNDFQGAYEAVTFLHSRGYQRIGFMAGPTDLNICHDRQAGFAAALREHHLTLRPDWIITSQLTEEDGYRQFKQFVEDCAELPEALVCTNDSMAHGVYRAAAERSLRIPEDIGVVGFGDLSMSRLLTPPLTTIRLPIQAMCQAAVSGLVKRIETENYTEPEQHFDGELMIRNSTK